MMDGAFSLRWMSFWLVLNGLAEFSFHFAFHAVSGLQIHKHQFRGDEHNHQCCRRPTNLFVEMLKFQGSWVSNIVYIGYGRAPMISDVKCNPTIDQRTGYTSLLVFEKIFPRIAVIEQMFNDMPLRQSTAMPAEYQTCIAPLLYVCLYISISYQRLVHPS